MSRNPTEDAILDAARAALLEDGFDKLKMETIAKRAFVSRTAVYFYFSNKRAVVDRLIQTAFADMYQAASVYLEGDGDPRVELHEALQQTVDVVNREQDVLLLAASLSGSDGQLPPEWASYILRFVNGAAARIARDQAAGLAPDDIPAAHIGPGAAVDGRAPRDPRAHAGPRERRGVGADAGGVVVARGVRTRNAAVTLGRGPSKHE